MPLPNLFPCAARRSAGALGPTDTSMRPQRPDAELAKAAHHLQYEFWMLLSVANALGSGIASQGWLTNALLESFVIHFRALLDFFHPAETPKADDVVASDYFDDQEEWSRLRPQLSEALRTAKRRAHKEIAHLTYARLDVTPKAKPWAFVDIANEIGSLMTTFRSNVPPSRLGLNRGAECSGA